MHRLILLVMDTPICIALCTLHGTDHVSIAHVDALEIALNQPLTHQGRQVHIAKFSAIGDEYARGRNTCIQGVKDDEARRGAKYDYILWLDDDIVVPADFLSRLLAHDLPIVSGIYVMRREPHLPVAYVRAVEPDRADRFWSLSGWPSGLVEVDAVGQGCVLIKREVYDKVPEPYYAWQPVKRDSENTFKVVDDAPDNHAVAVEDRTLGEDLYFFTHCRIAGYRIYADGDIILGHEGTRAYSRADFVAAGRIHRRTALPDKLSILFLPAPAPKPWDGRSLYTDPLGGSETAVAYLARSLVQKHHHAVTVATGSGSADVDGVTYQPQSAIATLLRSPWDIVVVSRWREALFAIEPDLDRIKRVIFWQHDIAYLAAMRDIYTQANALVQLTPWHAAVCQYSWPERKGLHEAVIPNGVDLSLFEGKEERVPGRLIWTANPNRGLPSAVRLFRKIRAKHPEMELHIYGRAAVYGWDPVSEIMYLPQADEPGVFVHDALPKKELARELMKAWAWFYPCHWMETFSIAALEAQAAGTPVISTPYGALVNTVSGGVLDWNVEQTVDDLMADPEYWELLSLRGKDFAANLDWDRVSDVWNSLFIAELGRQE
jgi:glycosyltransferase involved in cell wall biosynthesis